MGKLGGGASPPPSRGWQLFELSLQYGYNVMNVLNFLVLNKEESDNCWNYNFYCLRKTLIDMLYVQILVVNKNMSSK